MDERPIPQYATLAAAFWAIFGFFLLTNGRKIPERIGVTDVSLIALSSYKVSRLIAKEEITTFVRAPVTEDPEAQQPKRRGMARVLGELVTCPYCMGLWLTAAFSYGLVLYPRQTRFAMTIFGAYGVSDFLHAGFVKLRGS